LSIITLFVSMIIVLSVVIIAKKRSSLVIVELERR
jgi:hypothetical protein